MMYGHFHSQQAHALGDINSHGSTTWTSSKKAKYHHLAPQYQSVESYRHGAPASTSLILDNHAHASSIMEHANTSSTSSTGSNENSSNEDNTHNGHEIEERDLDVENEEDAAFLVYSLNQPLPPRNLNKAATHSSSSISSSIHHNCNSSSSIASSSCSVGGNSLLLSTRPASAASVLSASAMMSAVTGVISSTTSLTHTTTSTTSLLVVPSSVAEFQSIASVSSKDGPGIVSGISSIQEINAVLAAADLYLGQVVDHPPAWQVMRPVAVGSLTTNDNSSNGLSNKHLRLHQSSTGGNLHQVPVPKILLSVIPAMVPLPAEGGLSPRGIFSPSGGAKSPNGSISSQASQGPGLTLPSLQIYGGGFGSSNHSGSQAGSSQCGSGSDMTRLGSSTSTTNNSNNSDSCGTASGSGSDVDVNDGSSEKDSMEGVVAGSFNMRGGSSLSSGEDGSGRDTPL